MIRDDLAGWRLVPEEPTIEMIDAGDNAYEPTYTGTYTSDPCTVYRAMLAAAPQPPVQRKPMTDEEIEDACWTEVDQRLRSFARAIETFHGITGDEA